MSRIENSLVYPITRASTTGSDQRSAESARNELAVNPSSPFLDSGLGVQHCRMQNSNERRLNYALQSKKTTDTPLDTCDTAISNSQPNKPIGHSRTIMSHFETCRNLRYPPSEPRVDYQEADLISASPLPIIDHLETAICNVALGDGTASDNNNCEAPHAAEVDVAREVETVGCEGGGEEILDVEATAAVGTRESTVTAEAAAAATRVCTVESLQILAASKQDQNLKPILKRKDCVECVTPVFSPLFSLPPPILKKRDSLTESSIPLSIDNSTLANAATNNLSQRPASILKNRQPRGSYSFDENIHTSESSSLLEDGAHHLKPILKKKSWSIEEKIPHTAIYSSHVESVRGILKSSDKLTTSSSMSSSSSLKTSLVDDPISNNFSSCSTIAAVQSNSSPTKATLKGILKSSTKNRSASISPCSSSESIEDKPETDREPLSPKHAQNAFCRKVSLEESPESVPLDSSQNDLPQNNYNNGHCALEAATLNTSEIEHTSTSSVISVKPILKKANEASDFVSSETPNCSSVSSSHRECVLLSDDEHCLQSPLIQACFSSSSGKMSADSSSTESDYKIDSPDSSESKSEDDSSMNLTVFRRKNDANDSGARCRPKSCFVTSSEFLAAQPSQGDESKFAGNSSIAQRLALLKQNGEEGWKNRVPKPSAHNEIQPAISPEVTLRPKANLGDTGARGSVIANRLSSLLDSQTQWRSRVNESDAKQFTVASKQSRQSDIDVSLGMDSAEKVVLRGTPKRLGLRGSTLNPSALNSVSAKLNSVLRPEKSLLSSPLTPFKKKEEPTSSAPFTLESLPAPLESKPTTSQTVYLPKPDDEESFGSFFDLDNRKLNDILHSTTEDHNEPSLLSLDSFPTESLLLSNVKKSRIQAPKRRAASSHNPIKQLNKSCISTDSYSNVPNPPNDTSPVSSPSAKAGAKSEFFAKAANPNMALSALAGLASTEDFKSVANKLRNSSSVSSSSNDSWRAYDLKNSLQTRMLILVKGRHHAQIRLIEPTWRSLNLTDSFILVTKETVYAFIGELSNIIERTKCIEVAEQIRTRRELCYRSSSSDLVLIDGHLESVKNNLLIKLLPLLKELDFTDADKADWDKLTALSKSNGSIDEDDQYYEESLICTNMIYNVILNESKSNIEMVPVEKYWGRSPRHHLLQSDSVFVFDFGTEMYVWIGKNISNVHRKKAVDAAKDLWLKGFDYSEVDTSPFGSDATLKSDTRPDWAWFTRTNQNMETVLFKDKFFNWPAFTLTRTAKKTQRSNSTKDAQNTHHVVKKDLSQELNLFAVDAEKEMIHKQYQEPNLILENVTLGRGSNDIVKDDDGLSAKIISLEVQAFIIDDNGERVELLESDRNFLFTGESYYIRWKYRLTRISRCLKTGGESKYSDQHGGRDRLCYFVWQGKDARNTQRGTTALNAIDKLREEGASQEIIENGKETPAFLRIFDGHLVIQLGKRNAAHCTRGWRMFALKSTFPGEMFLAELEFTARNLRSRSSFIFINALKSKTIYIWHGCKSVPDKRHLMKDFLDNLLGLKSKEFALSETRGSFETVDLEEGKEQRDFFDIFTDSVESSPKRRARSNTLQRESNILCNSYFSLLGDAREYEQNPRLFHFSTNTERVFVATEVVPPYVAPFDAHTSTEYPFTQDDLYVPASSRPTFFLLDNQYEVYLWESKFPFFVSSASNRKDGDKSGANAPTNNAPRMIDIESEILSEVNLTTGSLAQLWLAERKCALETTLAYCHAKNPSEPAKAYVISAGLEPPSFCGLFPTWTYYENVAQLHIEDGRKPGQQILVQEILAQIRDIHTSSYSFEVLKRRPLPEGINILCLESYLDDQEFEKLFGFNREEFYSLPTWKQKNLKQEKELF